MNLNTVKRPAKRFSTAFLSTLNIQAYGIDNLYPQRMLELVLNSPTGGTCVERYQQFIEGNGYDDTSFSEYVVNRQGDTVDDIHRLMAHDMALYHGFALHVNYNMACEIVELQYVPFQNCRLEEENDQGQVLLIDVHPDWSGRKTRRGRRIPIDLHTISKIHTFNPKREVVLAQIAQAGSIEDYKGQILWFSMDGKNEYPRPIYDKIVTNLSTDEALDNVKYRNARNNFLMAGMLCRKKGSQLGIDADGNPIREETDETDFAKSLDAFQGDMNCCTIMDVTVQSDEDLPEFKSVEGTNYDAKFTCTEESVTARIYSAFGQEPWYCIRVGKLGFSGTVIQEAYEYYNSYVAPQRRALSRAMRSVFLHWYEKANKEGNYLIQPLVYIANENNGALTDTSGGVQVGSADRQR